MAVHYENCPNLCRTIDEIHEAGMKAGVMINLATPIRSIKDVITMTDMIGVMVVNPGFGGQKYIERTQEKVQELKILIDNKGANTLIEVDGGVNDVIGKRLAEAGADVLVAGSYIFNALNPLERIDSLYKL
jgi:ribulose-phosphate 3-epimerase